MGIIISGGITINGGVAVGSPSNETSGGSVSGPYPLLYYSIGQTSNQVFADIMFDTAQTVQALLAAINTGVTQIITLNDTTTPASYVIRFSNAPGGTWQDGSGTGSPNIISLNWPQAADANHSVTPVTSFAGAAIDLVTPIGTASWTQ